MTVAAAAHDASHALASNSHVALILGTTSPLLILSSILFLLQLYLRLRSVYLGYYRLGWDDSFLILAAVFNVAAFAFLIVAIVHGLESKVSLSQDARKQITLWLSVARPLWIWSSVWAKISLAVTIMRVKVSPLSRALTTAFLILVPVTIFALWLPTVIHHHVSATDFQWQVNHGLYLGVALVFLLADLILTVPPALFLFSKRPLAEIIIASFLCFLGACAVGCSIGRVVLQAQNYTHANIINFQKYSATSNVVPYIILAAVEASISVIAACTPTIFHFSAKAVHLIPSAYRDQLIRKKSTLNSRRDNATPEVGAAQQEPSDTMDRWSRDLGLDALPDNPRFSTLPPRMRRSWLSWRHSSAFASTNRVTLSSTEEAPNENSSLNDRDTTAFRTPTNNSLQQPSDALTVPSRHASGHSPASTNRDSSRISRSFARRSLWTQWSRTSEISVSDRRRSSSLAAWLQWENLRDSQHSALVRNTTLDVRQAEQPRSYADQTQILSFDRPSEKSRTEGHNHSQSQVVSTHESAGASPVSAEDDDAVTKPCEDSFEQAMSYSSPISESFEQEKAMADTEEDIREDRPLSWESAQHQYLEPQLSASLEQPPEFLWKSFDAATAAQDSHPLDEEHKGAWPLNDQRLHSNASADGAVAAEPTVLTIRNL